MKVGFITLKQHNKMAGTEQVLSLVVSSLEKQGINTKTYFIYEPEDESFLTYFKDYEIAHVPKFLRKKHLLRPRILYKIFHRRGVEKLFHQIMEDELDILFVLKIENEFLKAHSLFLDLKLRAPNLKIVSWPHCSLDNIMDKTEGFKDKLRVFDAHFAISDGLASQLVDDLQQKNVLMIYNPVKRAGYTVKRVVNKFLYVGRLDKDKRVLELLESLSKVSNRNWTLDIVGAPSEPEKNYLFIEQVKKYGLENNVFFHGWKANPWSDIKEAGVFLLNSSAEGFALVLVEAMMRGIPCIATDCRVGPSGIIQDGENGWLVDVHDDQRLVFLLEEILAGRIELPDSEKIVKSVEKFASDTVLNNFIQKSSDIVMHEET